MCIKRGPLEKFAPLSSQQPGCYSFPKILPMHSRVNRAGRRRGSGCRVQHHGTVDSSDSAAISPRPLSGLVCATEVGATSPNLTSLTPDRIYIQSRGREGGEGGMDQSEISRSRQYKQQNENRQTHRLKDGMPRETVLDKTRRKRKERGIELGFFMAAPHTHTHCLL